MVASSVSGDFSVAKLFPLFMVISVLPVVPSVSGGIYNFNTESFQ